MRYDGDIGYVGDIGGSRYYGDRMEMPQCQIRYGDAIVGLIYKFVDMRIDPSIQKKLAVMIQDQIG